MPKSKTRLWNSHELRAADLPKVQGTAGDAHLAGLSVGLRIRARRPAPTMPSYSNIKLTTTSNELHGYHVVREFGVVRGIIVRSRSILGNIGAGLQTLFGGNITLYTNMCERAREDAFQLMLQHASEQGANAIIAMRYDANEIASGVTEVLCYGTAVVVEPAVR
jgi:uncharacterized protein YbjQ (UPF0145 family)